MQYTKAALIAHTKEIRDDVSIVECGTVEQLLVDFERDIARWELDHEGNN